MKLYENTQYMEDVRSVAELQLPWNKLQNKSIMLSGATGLIGSFLIDVILEKNISDGLSCTVYALGRNEQKANARFSNFVDDDHLVFIPYDVRKPFIRDDLGTVDYVLHLASNTHPMQYSTDPIGPGEGLFNESFYNNVKRALKKGGILIYSVCSIAKAEGEKQVAEFLSQNKDFLQILFPNFLHHQCFRNQDWLCSYMIS